LENLQDSVDPELFQFLSGVLWDQLVLLKQNVLDILASNRRVCVCVCVCVQKPGCDLIFGSQQQEDACMVCGGHNSTCLHHRSVYQSNGQNNGQPWIQIYSLTR